MKYTAKSVIPSYQLHKNCSLVFTVLNCLEILVESISLGLQQLHQHGILKICSFLGLAN